MKQARSYLSRYLKRISNREFSLYSGDSKLMAYVAKPPSPKPKPAWNRLAHKIKGEGGDNENLFGMNENHIELLRESFDRRDPVLKLEDELAEEMAAALGRTGRKCQYLFDLLAQGETRFASTAEGSVEQKEIGRAFNEVRVLAREARRNLIIHRQAVGFSYRNHHIVEEEFPLPPPKIID